uniref:ADP,ATP carrier protein n=1 Tax=Tetradesmus obliquus TaxID=3088 RepID=A0A383VEW1_TETOB|eukprot:jgi/Sobl393_1/14190/SZX63721.1
MQCAAGPAQLGRAAFNTPAFRQTPGRPASAAVLGLGSRSLHSVSGTSRPLSQLPGLTQWSGLRRQVLPRDAAQPGGSAGSNSEQDKQRQAANNSSSSSSQGSHDNPALEFPLLLASSLSHVNRQYIKMRRRRKWWNKLGGYPKVPSENMDHLPEPAVELWQKVLPLGMIFFCASFNLTILQSLKDSIMVTAGGAEVLPFLASCCVLPASVAFFVLYGKLVAHLPEKAVFYAAVTPLLGYYALFAAAIYPIAGSLHPLELMAKIAPSVPVGLHGLLKVVGNWTYSLFFCMAELWGAVVISVLFWSLANEVCTVDEAKAVYPFMAIGANIALVAAGCYIRLVNHTLSTTVAGDTQLLSLRVLIGTVMAMTGAMFAAKAFIDAKVLQPALKSADGAAAAAGGGAAKPAGKKKKSKGSFGEGIAVLKKSPKIRNLALLVMSYGVGHRLFEFAWKGQLRLLYPTVQGYQSVLADVATYTGMLTLASMVVSRLVFQHAGWGVAASVTPAVMGVAGTMFFAGTLLAGLPSLSPEMAATIAGIGATAGVVTQVFARASKYSLFDPAKEMVYIEMDADEKKQGKAAVDLVGSQIGKSGASWITQAFLLGCGSIAAAMPFTGVVFAGVIITWIKATLGLHSQMQEVEKARLAQQQQQQAAAAAALGAGGAAAAAVGVAVGAAGVPAAAAAGGEFTEPDEESDSSNSSSRVGSPSDQAAAESSEDASGHGAAYSSHAVAAASSHVNGSSSSSSHGVHASSSSGSLESYVAAAVNGQLQQSGKAGSASSVNGGSGAQFNVNGHGVNGLDDGQQLNGAAKELSKVKLQ